MTKRNMMKIAVLSMLILGIFNFGPEVAKSGVNFAEVEPEKKEEWKLVWNDEFNTDKLDLTKWDYQIGTGTNGWGNYEQQYYTKNNVSVSNGALIIESKKENIGINKYSSGRIRTKTLNNDILFSTKYGKIEARMKLPAGSGLWPAFWMMPAEDAYGRWPLSGEIDIMEAKGRILNQVQGTIHYGEVKPNNKKSYAFYTFSGNENITDYHTYSVEWDIDKFTWYVDGERYFSENNWYTTLEDGSEKVAFPAPFNCPFYIIFNLAVGGNFDKGIKPADADMPARMEVDYVRVYHKADANDAADENTKNIEKSTDKQDENQNERKKSSSVRNNPISIESFENGFNKWVTYNTKASLQKIYNNSVCKIEAKPSYNSWDSMFIYGNMHMENDTTYHLSFHAKASLEDQLFVVAIQDSDNTVYFSREFLAGTDWKDYKFEFKAQGNLPLDLKYMLGAVAKRCSLFLDDVSIRVSN